MEIKEMTINGSELNFIDYAGGKDGTIIAAHGLTGNSKQLHYFALALQKNYRFISVDLKGRGNSAVSYENTSIHTHTEDILGLIKELEIENPILIGYSMGAFIMSQVATEIQTKGLILLDGAAKCTDHQRKIVEPSLGRISKPYNTEEDYLAEINKIYSNLGVTWGPHMIEVGKYEIHQVDDHIENKLDEKLIRQDFDSFYTYNPQEVFEKIDCPVLLIHALGQIGSMPALFTNESYSLTLQTAKNIQKIQTDANHYTLVFEERIDVNPYILNFLANL